MFQTLPAYAPRMGRAMDQLKNFHFNGRYQPRQCIGLLHDGFQREERPFEKIVASGKRKGP